MTFKKSTLMWIALASIMGCSTAEDEIYEAFKCSYAASSLGKDSQAQTALRKVEDRIKATGVNPAFFAMQLKQKFQDDVELYKYAPITQLQMLTDIYESSTCQKRFQ